MKLFAFTIDLESDYAGIVNNYGIFRNPQKAEELLAALQSLEIKVTVFVVAEILEKYPDIIRIFEKYNCEFEIHSYSHDLNNPGSEFEIKMSRTKYFSYFNRYPMGYRAPQGRISGGVIRLLEKHGFLYDSSVFPSYFPNPFKYLFCSRQIRRYENSNILEIPLTSISPFRLTLSLSYIKLFGIKLFMALIKVFGLPDVICFDSHLHDFIFNQESYSKLPFFWRFIYGRNKISGMAHFTELFKYIKASGYKSCFMSEIYNDRKEQEC